MQFLIERSASPSRDPCGHALMATCPLDAMVEDEIPFGHGIGNVPDDGGQKTWDLQKGDLANLLDLSRRLNLEGEITPVMAWGMVLAHPRAVELGEREIRAIYEELGPKIRCYG